MSRYATYQDVAKRYPAAVKAFQDADFESGYLTPAEDEVDGRLAALYTVPFTAPIPGLVKSLAIDVAYYKLTMRSKESESLRIYLYGKDGDGGIFGSILSGDVVIDTTATPNAASLDKSYHTRFGPDDPINWRPDTDSLIDVCQERADD